jgi:hypothetical protein
MSPRKARRVGGETIDVRRSGCRVAVAAGLKAHVVGDNDDDVSMCCRLLPHESSRQKSKSSEPAHRGNSAETCLKSVQPSRDPNSLPSDGVASGGCQPAESSPFTDAGF